MILFSKFTTLALPLYEPRFKNYSLPNLVNPTIRTPLEEYYSAVLGFPVGQIVLVV